jgi:hypothetical protein
MNKIAVRVNAMALGQQHDFLVPSNMEIKYVIELMAKILTSEYGALSSTSDLMLFDRLDFKALDIECSLSQLGISDGAKLILI